MPDFLQTLHVPESIDRSGYFCNRTLSLCLSHSFYREHARGASTFLNKFQSSYRTHLLSPTFFFFFFFLYSSPRIRRPTFIYIYIFFFFPCFSYNVHFVPSRIYSVRSVSFFLLFLQRVASGKIGKNFRFF